MAKPPKLPAGAGVIEKPLHQERTQYNQVGLEDLVGIGDRPAASDGAKAAGLELLEQIDTDTIEGVLKGAEGLLTGLDAEADQRAEKALARKPANVTVTTEDGFENKIAQDVFERTGVIDEAKRADLLTKMLTEDLYTQVKHHARNAGMDDESMWLKQHLGEMVAKEELAAHVDKIKEKLSDMLEELDPRVDMRDEKAGSVENQTIERVFGKSNLSALRILGRELAISNIAALRLSVSAAMYRARRTGLCGEYVPSKKTETLDREGVVDIILELLGKVGAEKLVKALKG